MRQSELSIDCLICHATTLGRTTCPKTSRMAGLGIIQGFFVEVELLWYVCRWIAGVKRQFMISGRKSQAQSRACLGISHIGGATLRKQGGVGFCQTVS